jgi:hypothetical protein
VVRAEAGSLNLKVRPWKARRVNKTIYDNGGNGLLRDRAPWAVFHIRFDKRPNKPLRLRHVHRGYSCGRNVVAVSGVGCRACRRVAPAGGNTCAPRCVRLDLRPPAVPRRILRTIYLAGQTGIDSNGKVAHSARRGFR